MRQNWTAALAKASANGPVLTAALRQTCLISHAKWPMPGGFLEDAGQQLLIKASGIISTVITTPGTARFDVDLGGTTVADTGAMVLDSAAAHTAVGWSLEMWLKVHALGASTSFAMTGTWSYDGILRNFAPGVGNAFDGAVPALFDLRFTQTVATGSLTVQQYALISVN